MRLNQVTVGSTDVPRAIEFYCRLGLVLIVHTHDKYARFLCPDGSSTFSVHQVERVQAPATTTVYFACDDVDATVAALKERGLQFDSDPKDQVWLWREAYLHDPDNNPICLFTPGKNRVYPPWRKPESLPGHAMHVDALDHVVLTVRSIEATVAFYERALGMRARTFGKGRVALHFGEQKFNLHQSDRPVDENVRHAKPGSADLCLLTKVPLEEVIAHLERVGVAIIEGPGERTGAQGPIRSVYIYDPDENLIEIANQL